LGTCLCHGTGPDIRAVDTKVYGVLQPKKFPISTRETNKQTELVLYLGKAV
jgi:hypothetical protein